MRTNLIVKWLREIGRQKKGLLLIWWLSFIMSACHGSASSPAGLSGPADHIDSQSRAEATSAAVQRLVMCWGEALEIGSDQAVGAACQWYLDGAALQGQTGNVFEYRPLLEDLGVHRLEVKVADAPLEKSLSWEVYVSLSYVECMYGLGYPWSVEGYDHLVATREELEQALENAADEDGSCGHS